MSPSIHAASRPNRLLGTLRVGSLGLVVLVGLAALIYPVLPHRIDVKVACATDARICRAWEQRFFHDTSLVAEFTALPTREALGRIRDTQGHPEFDLWVGGDAENYYSAAHEGLLQPAYPANAAQLDPHFKDPAHQWFGVYASVLGLCINPTVLHQQGLATPRAWTDLQDPSYRGWISAPSPLSSATAHAMLLAQRTAGVDEPGLKRFIANVDRFTRSGNAPAGVVASGEAAVAVLFHPYCSAADTPLTMLYPTDGTTYEVGSAAVIRGTTRPDGAELALNWLLSPRGQTAARDAGVPHVPVARDVPDNLQETLAKQHIRVTPTDPAAAAQEHEAWQAWFANYLRDPQEAQAPQATQATPAEVPEP